MKERSDLAHIGSAWKTLSVWEKSWGEENKRQVICMYLQQTQVDQYSGSQLSLAGSRKRALRDKIALSRNVCSLLMGMDCKDAFIWCFHLMLSFLLSCLLRPSAPPERRAHNPQTSGNTFTVLSLTSHEQLELQSLHYFWSYNGIESPVELPQKRRDLTNPSVHKILPGAKSLSTFDSREREPQGIIICTECDMYSRLRFRNRILLSGDVKHAFDKKMLAYLKGCVV